MAFWSKTSPTAASAPLQQQGAAPEHLTRDIATTDVPSLASRMSTIDVQDSNKVPDTSTTEAPSATDTAPASAQTQDQRRQAALASKMMMAAYGEIVSVLSRSPHHRTNSLADLEWVAAPAVMTGQFSLAEAQMKGSGLIAPVGLVMWANVSADVDQRLTANIATGVRLKPDEWRSGDILWLVDAVGESRIVEAMLKRLVATEWKGREARMRARTKEGTFKVGVITQVTRNDDQSS